MAHSGRHLLCKPGDLGLDCHHLPKKLSVAMQTTIAVLGGGDRNRLIADHC